MSLFKDKFLGILSLKTHLMYSNKISAGMPHQTVLAQTKGQVATFLRNC